MELNYKWALRFLELTEHVSEWSKDPSTKVGAVIIRPNKSICSVGFNGFPQGVRDDEEDYLNREIKLKKIVHAEINAINFATESLRGYTLFTYPLFPCSICAGSIIQKGISTVVSLEPCAKTRKRWYEDTKLTTEMFSDANIKFVRNYGKIK